MGGVWPSPDDPAKSFYVFAVAIAATQAADLRYVAWSPAVRLTVTLSTILQENKCQL